MTGTIQATNSQPNRSRYKPTVPSSQSPRRTRHTPDVPDVHPSYQDVPDVCADRVVAHDAAVDVNVDEVLGDGVAARPPPPTPRKTALSDSSGCDGRIRCLQGTGLPQVDATAVRVVRGAVAPREPDLQRHVPGLPYRSYSTPGGGRDRAVEAETVRLQVVDEDCPECSRFARGSRMAPAARFQASMCAGRVSLSLSRRRR
jgi:hypothetical protein